MIITLTTDFGLKDPFVGAMKGVILGLLPNVQIIDISHEIPSYDVTEASLVVYEACRYFPRGTIHVVVVDPGVGSTRRPIALRTIPFPTEDAAATESGLSQQGSGNGQIYIAPDNGVLSLVSDSADSISARHITNTNLFHRPVSQTFHGRDIFAPVAAHLAAGTAMELVGPVVNDLVRCSTFENPTVLRVDKFGNLLTNLRLSQLYGGFVIRAGGVEIRQLVSSYSEAHPGEVFAIEGSAGLIELSLNQDSAADRLNLRRGAEFEVETGTLNH
jgi:S-adenosyl-L-methionine hydrolase (adenosine-forming)